MAKKIIKYFYDAPTGPIELEHVFYVSRTTRLSRYHRTYPDKTVAEAWPDVAVLYTQSRTTAWVGYSPTDPTQYFPATRVIQYSTRPSGHQCGAKCRGAKKDGPCECQCGGKFHGIGS